MLADYFIIASGANEKQVQAMADNVCEKLAENGVQPRQTEGYLNNNSFLSNSDYIQYNKRWSVVKPMSCRPQRVQQQLHHC